MSDYRRWDIPLLAVELRVPGTFTSAVISLDPDYEPLSGFAVGNPPRRVKGPARHGRICVGGPTFVATGTIYGILQGLIPNQDSTLAYYWRSIGTTTPLTAQGCNDLQVDGPLPHIMRGQLVVATANVTAGLWLELGG